MPNETEDDFLVVFLDVSGSCGGKQLVELITFSSDIPLPWQQVKVRAMILMTSQNACNPPHCNPPETRNA